MARGCGDCEPHPVVCTVMTLLCACRFDMQRIPDTELEEVIVCKCQECQKYQECMTHLRSNHQQLISVQKNVFASLRLFSGTK